MTYNFYSTTREHRIAEIERINDDRPILRVRDLLDDISDGCGGCERMMVSTADGNDGWITCLAEEGNRVWYAFIEAKDLRQLDVDAFATTEHPPQQIVRATYGSICPRWDEDRECVRSHDAWETYVEFLRMIEESDQEEE